MDVLIVRGVRGAIGLFGLALGLFISQAAAQSTTTLAGGFRSLDHGATGTAANGINTSAEVVGWYFDQAGNRHGFLYDGSTFASRDFSTNTAYQGINDNSEIAGYYVDQTNPTPLEHGFLFSGWTLTSAGFSGGTFSSIDYPGSTGTQAAGINNGGQIVGHYVDQAGTKHGFLYSGGSFTSIDYPGSTSTLAYGINKNGDIVGVYYDNASNEHGFLYSAGTFRSLDYPNSTGTSAEGINDSGRVVGHYFDNLGAHGFLYNGGRLRSLNYPGATDTRAQGINNGGQIVGIYYDTKAPSEHGFLLEPILIDPATPDPVAGLLVSNGQVLNDPARLAESQNIVVGIAADGVARLVVRIPAANVGDHVQLSIWNDQSQLSTAPQEDGYLTSLDGQQDSRVSGTIDVAAVNASNPSNTSTTPMAFAVYHAPLDFARKDADRNITKRNVSLASQTGLITTFSIVRPPILLVHGLWSNRSTWLKNGFQQALEGFFPAEKPKIYLADYHDTNGGSVKLNEGIVLTELRDYVDAFKNELSVAAIQADVVGHSMGGLIARYTIYDPRTSSNLNFKSGYVHKIITIDTPHLGSPFPERIRASNQVCQAFISGQGSPIGDALIDLSEGSNLLFQLANPLRAIPPSHAIAGTVTPPQDVVLSHALSNFTLGLSNFLCPSLLPEVSYQLAFGHDVKLEPNDIAVGITSQLGGGLFSRDTTADYDPNLGIIHSHDTMLFGAFNLNNLTNAIGALDANSPNPLRVFNLLNKLPNNFQSFVSRGGYPFQ